MSRYGYKIKKPDSKAPSAPRRVNRGMVIAVLAAVVAFYAVYLCCFNFGFKEIVHVYAVILLVCGITFGVLNRGFSQKPLTRGELPSDWDDAACEAELARDKKLRRKAKFFLVPALAVLLTFMFDLLYLQVFLPVFGG